MNEIKSFDVVKKTKLTKSEFSVQCNVAVQGQATKILTLSTVASVSGCEVLNGCINYAGNIDVRIVYLTEDGEVCTVASACPFTSKFEGDYIANGQRALIAVKVVETNVEAISQDVRIECILEQEGVLVSSLEVKSVSEGNENDCYKTEDIEVYKFVGEQSERVTVTSEIAVRQPVKKLILSESQAIVKNVESGVNFVSVSGEVVTRVLYLSEDDRFETSYVYDNFKEELEIEGATRDSQVEAYVSVKSEEVKAEIEQGEKGTNIVIDLPIVISAKVYGKATVTVVKDLYSTKSELRLSTQSFDMTHVCPMINVEAKIDGSLTLDENQPRVDKILFVGGNSVVVSNNYVKDGEVFIEGIARTSVVYLNDETGSINSVQIEVPFVVSDKFDYDPDGILVVDAVISDVDVSVKKGREFNYDARIKASVNYCHQEVGAVISDVETLEQFSEKDYGLELFFARAGQDAWDISKAAHISQQLLLEQNPDVVFPLEEDKSLILYYQKLQ